MEAQTETVSRRGRPPRIESLTQEADTSNLSLDDKSNPVKLAFLHQSVTWPGVCGSEKTLSDDKIRGIKMYVTFHGLVMHLKGKRCLIPHTNVVNYVLE